MTKGLSLFEKRRRRNRTALRARGGTRARLSVHRSGKHIYAQVIDDTKGVTLVACSTQEKDVMAQIKDTDKKGAAKIVGKLIAERASEAGIKQVVFDRGGYVYTGRVAELAAGAREAGLEF